VTHRLSELYNRIVTGREPRYESWLTRAYASTRVSV